MASEKMKFKRTSFESPNGDAEIDKLTELRNLRWLDNHLPGIIHSYPGEFALVFADMDNLKEVNDEYDHDEGDQYIANVAHVLHEMVRREDSVVVRISGDELIILLMGVSSEENMNLAISRFTEELDDIGAPTSLGGVVHMPGQTGEDLKKAADAASQFNKHQRQIANLTVVQIEAIGDAAAGLEAESVSLRGLASRVEALRDVGILPPPKS
jgi:diguanylate cyclase (GGDEF)-like protein